jgi:hypothetical protein
MTFYQTLKYSSQTRPTVVATQLGRSNYLAIDGKHYPLLCLSPASLANCEKTIGQKSKPFC